MSRRSAFIVKQGEEGTPVVEIPRKTVKWSQKIELAAKIYQTLLEGHEYGNARDFLDQFKAEVALEALLGDKTVQEIAADLPTLRSLNQSRRLSSEYLSWQ